MSNNRILNYIKEVLKNIPNSWLDLTTHRLDIYNEKKAKSQFLDQLNVLYKKDDASQVSLSALPTAYDYIRLGHPLSCILEWYLANMNNLTPQNVISFSSRTMPILAILRKNHLDKRNTQIIHNGELPQVFKSDIVRDIYGYNYELKQISEIDDIPAYEGSTLYITQKDNTAAKNSLSKVDFLINIYETLGSIVQINGQENQSYISAIQHVRRRESIAMTPHDCLRALRSLTKDSAYNIENQDSITDDTNQKNKKSVLDSIRNITGVNTEALLSSCGLSIQYAIMMGLIHDAQENHKGKAIKFIVPPNCYGGTNDQARRVAACIDNVEVVDLPVDGNNDMVKNIEIVLDTIAQQDAIPYIIAEIPTNPRVEVPHLQNLKDALSKKRITKEGNMAIDPVFILDQTFCPNVHFLGDNKILSTIRTIAYVSGSKFPSGGLCTAGYCVGNSKTKGLLKKVEAHLQLCDNEATNLQVSILAKQMPSMTQRINDAYKNTREFVTFIKETLPKSKINFVSENLAQQGFTPSVFSLDLPTIGDTPEEKESRKRELNYTLIKMMIEEIPNESKNCVSYGQLKGCYWTIPATTTQGTTKEGDKDYIVRISLSPDMNVTRHKEVFAKFAKEIS